MLPLWTLHDLTPSPLMKLRPLLLLLLLPLAIGSGTTARSATTDAEIVAVRKIWDAAPHNAFTDLVRFKNQWFCVFREGKAHVSPDGALRVIRSADGVHWESAALLTSTRGDLRDAKITITPDYRLMLSGAVALAQRAEHTHQSLAWFSKDGTHWTEPVNIGDPDLWLWRTTWYKKTAYSVGYDTTAEKFIRLYSSKDGKKFNALVPRLFDEGNPNETSLLFLKDGTCLCLLRRDGKEASGQLGIARPPYTEWEWKDLEVRIGGPHMLALPDGRIVAAVRLYQGAVRTALMWLDPEEGELTEILRLPSGGDCSYPGLVWHNDLLWVSYYSSHEGKTSIFLATVRFPPR